MKPRSAFKQQLAMSILLVNSDVKTMRTPDGHSKLDQAKYHSRKAHRSPPPNPPNTVSLHRVMFAVDDIDDPSPASANTAAKLLGEIAQY
jgi:hypothetical protein